MSNLEKMKQDVLEYARRSYKQELFAGTSGNLSIYSKDDNLMVITPSSIPYETMSIEDIMVIDLDGNIIEGKNRPSSEWRMHATVYKNKPEVGAVIHTHSPYATSFAVSKETIPVVLIEMVPFLGGDIHVAGFGMPGTDAVGINAVAALEERNACLLESHGVLAVGPNLPRAHTCAIYTEDVAKIYHFAKCHGNANVISQDIVQAMLDRKKKRLEAALK